MALALEKKPLSLEDIDSQTALELPDRETPGSLIDITCAVCIGVVSIPVDVDVSVAANVCTGVEVVAALTALSTALTNATGRGVDLVCAARAS